MYKEAFLLGETPLHPLTRFAQYLGVDSCWIKRDDLTGLAFGGNKVRKLEYLLGRVKREQYDLIITGGSPGSNHCRLTAAAANRLGVETWLCFSGKHLGPLQGNRFLDQLLGAKIVLTGCYGSADLLQAMEEKAEEARQQGRKPLVIPVGGSTTVGDYGYVRAWYELESQRKKQGILPFQEIYVTVGTGGTMAGLLAGQRMSRQQTSKVIGVSVWLKREEAAKEVARLTNDLLREHGETTEILPESIPILDQFIGLKYGVPSPEGNQAIRCLAQLEGIFTDPVYTGKALAGMIDRVSQKKDRQNQHLLFWHTGGTPALFTQVDSFFKL